MESRTGHDHATAGEAWRLAPAVFIVGASRSGTELLRSVLNGHPAVHVARETHYFDDLRARLAGGGAAPASAGERAAALDHFVALEASAYGYDGARLGETRPEARAALDAASSALGPSVDAIFAAHCLGGDPPGTGPWRVWGEKTPRHVFRGAEILTALPGARLVVAVRDPRGAVSSYRDWTNRWFQDQTVSAAVSRAVAAETRRVRRSWSLTLATLMWRSAMATAIGLQGEFGADRVHLVRFEDLVSRPEPTIAALCRFLRLPADPGMARVSVVNSSYVAGGRQSGFRPEAALRWRQALSPAEQRHVERVAGAVMRDLGYAPVAAGRHHLFSAAEFLRFSLVLPRAVLVNRKRIGNLRQAVLARLGGMIRPGGRAPAARAGGPVETRPYPPGDSAVPTRAHSAALPGNPSRSQVGE